MATALGQDDIFIPIFSQCEMVSTLFNVVSLLKIQWELFGFRSDLFNGTDLLRVRNSKFRLPVMAWEFKKQTPCASYFP